jgi:tetratricopeptide (TPR) repeat protein
MRRQGNLRFVLASFSMMAFILLGSVTGCFRDPNMRKQKYLESGERYLAKGKLQEAAIQFFNALKVDHNFADAHYQLGHTYIKEGMLQAGYIELIHTVDLEPSNIQARIDLGNLAVAGGDLARAKEQAKAVLGFQPRNGDAYALLAAVAASTNNQVEALAQISHAVSIDPNRAAFHAALGLMESSDPATASSAEQQLWKSIALDPKNPTSHIVLSLLLAQKGDLKGAEEQDKAAIAVDPQSLRARSILANLYLRQGNKTDAEITLRQGTELLSDTKQGAELLQSYYAGTGQLDRGVAVYSELVSQYPKSTPLKVAYAHLLLSKGDAAKAKIVAADLTKTSSGNPEVATLNGMILLNDGKAGDAFDVLQKAEQLFPENVQVKLWLGRAAIAEGNAIVAEQSFRDAAKISPASLEAQQGLAQLASQREDYSQLIKIANTTLSAHPRFTPAYIWRGTAEVREMQFDKADSDFRLVLKSDPKNASAYLGLGETRLLQHQFPAGTAMLEQALVCDPNSTRALRLLAWSDWNAKQPQKAIERVEQQIATVPNNQEMYDQLAQLQMDAGDLAAALATADKAMQLTPLESSTVMVYTRVQIRHGNVGKAILSWRDWSEKHPANPQVYALLGTLEQSSGDQTTAVEYYEKALQLQPDQPVAANNLAYLLVENGHNQDRALMLAQSARRGMPDSPSTADTLAWVYYHKGMYASARDLLEDAIKMAPDNASIQYHLGMTDSRLSDRRGAMIHLAKAATLAPNTQMARDAGKMLH